MTSHFGRSVLLNGRDGAIDHEAPLSLGRGIFVVAVPAARVAPDWGTSPGDHVHPRPIRGELLRDASGRFYERIGPHVRPLHRPVVGPNGAVFDLLPAERHTLTTSHALVYGSGSAATDYHEAGANDLAGPSEPGTSVTSPHPPADSRPYTTLAADPGLWQVVQWGDVKRLLAPQVLYPERLRDSHRLPCYVQVYEVTRPERRDVLTLAIAGDLHRAAELQVLDDAFAAKLGLVTLLQTRPRSPHHPGREPGVLLPYDRLVRLQLAGDPTAGLEDRAGTPQRGAAGAPVAPVAPAASASGHPEAARESRRSIPERLVRPWEFRFTREEVMYDMSLAATLRGVTTAALSRLRGWRTGRRDLKKWRALLEGKSSDEQLWTISPPSGRWSDPKVREWARVTLERAGYDARAMLWEWEIFWRRKGV